ncbi:hypothetical protein TrRE_jg12081 [Triparma retinervis]|uniref:Photosystem II 12 kDa extrinsic protein n=1 Tax=Triparma retinervis TaxID=2557542 RepID=A0A9W6ZNG5_9STRA|nr:hypothetical protein TrRE_jg12081 [Triparma retinervis]
MKSFAILILISLLSSASAYTPAAAKSRKSFLRTAITSALLAPQAVLIAPPTAQAISPFIDDYEVVDGQQATGGKIDLNSAYVTDYKQFRGLYPTIAGKLASHGPYKNVKDMYKMAGITKNEQKILKTYEKEFIVQPPGRLFLERVNARQST